MEAEMNWLSNIEARLQHERLRVALAQDHDSADVTAFIVEMLRRDSQELWTAEDLHRVGSYYARHGGRFLIIRDFQGNVVGTGAYKKVDGTRVELRRLYLDPILRGKGVAKLLILELIAEARSLGFSVMELKTASTCTEAIQLYRKLGFRSLHSADDSGPIHFELDLHSESHQSLGRL